MTEIAIFEQEKSDLSETIVTDDGEIVNVLATRTMNLKVKGDHLYAGPNCALQNAKFIYVLKADIQATSYDDGTPISWEGMELGNLVLPEAAGVLTMGDALVTVCDGSGLAVSTATTPVAAISGTEVDVVLPELVDADYGVGYSVVMQVTIFTEADLSEDLVGETVVENAWTDVTTVEKVI